MSRNNSISVVIPNYNGRALLEKNIPPLLKALHKSEKDFEIIVSDDASTDDSVAFLQQNFPAIKVISAPKNNGFSVTINKGIMAAEKDLVLALNSDVVLHEDYFIPQFKYFDAADTFGVMGWIDTENGDRIQDAAKYPEWKISQVKATKNYLISTKLLSNLGKKEVIMEGSGSTEALSFPQRLRELRQRRNWSQGQLAKKAGIDTQRISKYERGLASPPLEALVGIARVLEVSVDYLLTGKGYGVQRMNNPKLLERLEGMETLPQESQETLISVLDSFIKRYKFEQLARSLDG